MSKVKSNTFTIKKKPIKRTILHNYYSDIFCKKDESIITLGGPTPQFNFQSIKSNLGKNSKYVVVEYDSKIYRKMKRSITQLKDSRIISHCGDVMRGLDPFRGFTSKLKKIKLIDLDFCKTIKQIQKNNILEKSLSALVSTKKLSSNFNLMFTFSTRSGRLCKHLTDVKSTYPPKMQKSGGGWYTDYVINTLTSYVDKIFKKKYKKIEVSHETYKDHGGNPMIFFLFKMS